MIESLKETVLEDPGFYVGWFGLALGFVFGFVIFKSNFCSMGSISDIVTFGDYRRFRTWLLAIAVAMIGAQFVHYLGMVDLGTTMYRTPSLNWLANIVGGLLFGFGMVFAGGCVTKNLVRAGSGDLRSLVVLIVVGIFAYMTIGGLFGLLRVGIFGPTVVELSSYSLESQGLNDILSSWLGMSGENATLIIVSLVVLALLVYCLKDSGFRGSLSHTSTGVILGLCVTFGWALTGLAFDEFGDPVIPAASLTFVRPAGDTLEYLMRFTAFGAPSFAVVTVMGTLLGAFVASFASGRFRMSTFADVADTKRNLFGAALMGVGGVLALGCTVGQALTGVSTLAVGSFLAFGAILVGGFIGVHTLNRMLMADI